VSEHWRIESAGYCATVLAAGGGLGSLTHDGRDVVAGPGIDGPVSGARGQLLLPWPNRVRDGRFEFGGATYQLPLSEPQHTNAIHGLTRWCTWTAETVMPAEICLGCTLVAQSGYPWELGLSARYAVAADGLTVTLGAENRSETVAPFAAGMHPYLDLGCPVDEVELTVPASHHLVTDHRHLPVRLETAAGEHDFAGGRRIGSQQLDDAWTGLSRDDAGWATVCARGAYGVQLDLDPAWSWVQVFTGDTLAAGARRSLAVEPMTASADAFNSGADLVALDPGQIWSGSFRISLLPDPAAGPSAG